MIINDKEVVSSYPPEDSIRQTCVRLYESDSPLDDHPIFSHKILDDIYYPSPCLSSFMKLNS